ncbi:LysR family transcriptional regulator [Bowmanella denitrificans]|uniref:LysR family transcriptional regulator n=1 Tax=Bowmanella denitrificans TaxID=366582 RepID=UPI001559C1DA|nr:LysR family transcriptional regulator [Bowmanella denitrificans]
MALSLEQLEAFLAAVETGSFSAAARKLGKAQSSISGLISNLESDTGLPLFDRSTREPRLTRQGQALMEDVKAVLKSHNHLRYRVSHLTDKVEPAIGIAYDNLLVHEDNINSLIRDFERAFPSTSLMLLHATHHGAYQLLEEHKVDIAIGLRQHSYTEQYGFTSIGQVQFAKVASISHPLTKLSNPTESDLVQHRQLRITDNQSGTRQGEDRTGNAWYCNSPDNLLAMLKMGLGWADIPLQSVASELQNGRIVRLNCNQQALSFPQSLDLVWRKEGEAGKCQQWLLERLTLQHRQSEPSVSIQ